MSTTAHQTLTIERAGGEELDEVMEVMTAAFDRRFGEGWTRAQCAGILPMADVSLMLARRGDSAVGFSLSRRTQDEAELLLIAVHPDCSRSGIGGLLLQRFIVDQQIAGARHLHLEVRDGNPAVQLYLDHGFAIAGRRNNYYRGTDGEKFDALTMVLSV